MRCSMCGMNDCCGADMEQEIDALRAEVARLRAENAELRKNEQRLDSAICLLDAFDGNGPGSCTDRLVATVTAAGAYIQELRNSWKEAAETSGELIEENEQLRAQIAAHEKVCAGVWVKVTERLPKTNIYVPVLLRHKGHLAMNYDAFDPEEGWHVNMFDAPEYFLDARMPNQGDQQ